MKNKIYWLLLTGIILLGTVIRIWKVDSLTLPPNGDEVAYGYYGWSILHHGTDEYGNKFPASFVSVGDYKYPGLAYLNTIPALIFGLTNYTIRFWSVVSGSAGILLVYLATLYIFRDKTKALFSALFYSFSPWAVTLSRIGFETNAGFLFSMTGIVFLLYFSTKLRLPKFAFLIIIPLIVATFTFAEHRVFIPFFLISILIYHKLYRLENDSFRRLVYACVGIIILLTSWSLFSPNQRGRAEENIWRTPAPDEKDRLQQLYIGAGISEIRIPPRVTWLFHNELRVYLLEFTKRYLYHFSPEYLFFEGEKTMPEDIPDMGLVLFIEIALIPIGAITLLLNKERKRVFFFFAWILIAPLASSLTFGDGYTRRSLMLIPALCMLSANGLSQLMTIPLQKHIKGGLGIFLATVYIYSAGYFLNQYFIQKPTDRPWFKEQVFSDVVVNILSVRNNYENIVIGDDDYIYFLFYGRLSPREFLDNSKITPLSDGAKWERVESLYNIVFKMPFGCPKSGKVNVLYVCRGNEVPQNSNVLKVFYYKDGIPAYTFIEFLPLSKVRNPLPAIPKDLHYMKDFENNPKYPDGIIPDSYPGFW